MRSGECDHFLNTHKHTHRPTRSVVEIPVVLLYSLTEEKVQFIMLYNTIS